MHEGEVRSGSQSQKAGEPGKADGRTDEATGYDKDVYYSKRSKNSKN